MDVFVEDWYDDAECHSTSPHLKLLTKEIMRRLMMLFLYQVKDEAYKYSRLPHNPYP